MLPVIRPPQRAAFNFWIPQWRWLHKLGRRMGFIPLMFSGIWGIPYAMPAPTPLNLVVGKPIVVPKMEGECRRCACWGCVEGMAPYRGCSEIYLAFNSGVW
jgi:hypothetical protein